MRSHLAVIAIAGSVLLMGGTAHAALTFNSLTANALSINGLNMNSLTLNGLNMNALSANALVANALTSNAIANTGSAVSDLNGVAVEGVTLPQSLSR